MRPARPAVAPVVRALAVAALAALTAGATQCSYRKHTFGSSATQTATGSITGFGSTFVGGTEFSTANATIRVDGASAAESALAPGQVAVVAGRPASGGATPGADTITVDAALVGAVDAVDAAAGTVTVLGTTVHFGADTSYGSGIDAAGTAPPLAVGDRIAVHGWSGAAGPVYATRVERAAASRDLQVAGRLTSLDAGAKTYATRGAVVDYSAATSVDAALAAGAVAVATGTTTNPDGSLRASVVSVRADPTVANGDAGDLEGLVTRYASATDFDVAGRTVSTGSTTTFVNGVAGDLAAGVRLVVHGTYDASAHLNASRVQFARAAHFRVLAPVETFLASGGGWTGGGVTVQVDARTRYEDRSSLALRTFRLADLHTGEWVEARGVEESASRTATALVVERRDVPPGLRYELQGLAQDAVDPGLTLVGVPVVTTGAEFRDAAGALLTSVQFYSRAAGAPVVARGRFSGTTLVADSVQLRP
jgi:hypothetical protein